MSKFFSWISYTLSLIIVICIFPLSCSKLIDEEFFFVEENDPNKSVYFSLLNIGDITDVIYSARNYLIEEKQKEGKAYLRISKDLGNTWKEFENIYGDIVYFHIFSTGDIFFATTSWCYYIDVLLTQITPSQVYDYSGAVFKPVAKEHFFQMGDSKNYIWKVDGTEILVWGDYSFGQSTDPKYIARVWYSNDYGRTVKCAINFKETKIDGKIQKCRHTHGVRFDKYDNIFYIPTGDSGNECQLIKGEYNPGNDSWSFHRVGSGVKYKISRLYFDKDNIYFVTDYTTNQTQSGVIKCNKNSIGDTTKFVYLYKNPENRALTTLEFDMNGNKVLLPDGTGKTFIYYAKSNFDFKKIPTNGKGWIFGFTSPNYKGDVYARISHGFPYKLDMVFNFTESMRNSGVWDYMDIKEPKSLYFDEDFFFTYSEE